MFVLKEPGLARFVQMLAAARSTPKRFSHAAPKSPLSAVEEGPPPGALVCVVRSWWRTLGAYGGLFVPTLRGGGLFVPTVRGGGLFVPTVRGGGLFVPTVRGVGLFVPAV